MTVPAATTRSTRSTVEADRGRATMSRALGVDVGTVRVGLATSDPGRIVATPLDTLDAGDANAEDWAERLAARLAEVAESQGCDVVVVGLPKSLSGRDSASTRTARAVASALERLGVDVALWDERLSSAEAERLLIGAGRRREQRRGERDAVAATLILQGWLDAQGGA